MRLSAITVCAIGALACVACDSAGNEERQESTGVVHISVEAGWATAVDPKPVSNKVRKGLDWLLARQLESGAWGQGEESARMGQGMAHLKGTPNVADTAMATLALIRSGLAGTDRKVRAALDRALDYICGEVESAPEEGLAITKVTGTRVQAKIGPYVDTFVASLVLNEIKGRTGSEKRDRRVLAALDKVMDKIEKNQGADGTWDRRGWAPVLTQGLAGKAVNLASQTGYAVSEDVLARVEKQAQDAMSGVVARGPTRAGAPGLGASAATGAAETRAYRAAGATGLGLSTVTAEVPDAGVELYKDAANLSNLSQSMATNYELKRQYLGVIADNAAGSAARTKAKLGLERIEKAGEAAERARKTVVAKIADPRFVSGFGTNGGEEFLSYMQLSESLVIKGDDVWERWDKAVSDNLNRVQNEDGSWTGHHCITGRTFCTSAALLTLMADRMRFPETAIADARSAPAETK